MKKLRNKETGEIGELQITEKHYAVVVGNGTADCNAKIYSSLDELNEKWEDYHEETKKTWFIDEFGNICDREAMTLKSGWDDKPLFEFETREEAEKAVEKLKAWKRLKDNSFRFVDLRFEYDELGGTIKFKTNLYDGINDELDLLFGGKE